MSPSESAYTNEKPTNHLVYECNDNGFEENELPKYYGTVLIYFAWIQISDSENLSKTFKTFENKYNIISITSQYDQHLIQKVSRKQISIYILKWKQKKKAKMATKT